MQKIDRLGWAAGLSFRSYGVSIGVRVNNHAALEEIIKRLPAGWKPAPSTVVERLYSLRVEGEGKRRGVRRFSLLYGDITQLERALNHEQVFEKFESDLRLFIAEQSRQRVFVHAGVVGWRGRAIIMPGRSMKGKTTMVAELLRAGAEYYSDEFAVIDARGRVHPYNKPLGMREPGSARQRKQSVESLGGSCGVRPLPIGLVLVAEYKQGARWRPRRLSTGQGMLALLDNTVSIRRQPETALAALRQAVAHTPPVLKGVRGEARAITNSVLAYLDKSKGEKHER